MICSLHSHGWPPMVMSNGDQSAQRVATAATEVAALCVNPV